MGQQSTLGAWRAREVFPSQRFAKLWICLAAELQTCKQNCNNAKLKVAMLLNLEIVKLRNYEIEKTANMHDWNNCKNAKLRKLKIVILRKCKTCTVAWIVISTEYYICTRSHNPTNDKLQKCKSGHLRNYDFARNTKLHNCKIAETRNIQTYKRSKPHNDEIAKLHDYEIAKISNCKNAKLRNCNIANQRFGKKPWSAPQLMVWPHSEKL